MELNGGNVCFAASAAAAGRAAESDVTDYGAYIPPTSACSHPPLPQRTGGERVGQFTI